MANGQTHLWGTCASGGTFGHGTIFTTDGNGNNFNTIYSFDNINGAYPWGNMVFAPNGKIYGVTAEGVCASVIFEYDPVTHTNLDVFDFCNYNSSFPIDGMILGIDGNLYGLSRSGGSSIYGGYLYRFNPVTHLFDTLYNFTAITGYHPCSRLLQLNNKLYGTTYDGGTGTGVIFSFDLSTFSYSVLHNFDTTTCGAHEYSNLIFGTDGKLYGTSKLGNVNNWGFIFSYDISTNIYNELYDFNSTQGSDPRGGLIQASDGKLYGLTASGGIYGWGVIYSFDISNSTYSKIFDFDGTHGGYPDRKLMQASNGLLFGVTWVNGPYNYGVMFSYNLTTSTYIDLYNFDNGTNGGWPDCNIIELPDNLTTAINPIPNKESITLYPNPASSILTLHSQLSILNSQFIITDVLGNEVYHQAIINSNNQTIDISQWSNGVYFYQLINNTETVRGKFIKQ